MAACRSCLPGDIGRDTERAIAARLRRRRIRILKVPHHGSATSSSPEFLQALASGHRRPSATAAATRSPSRPPVLDRYRDIGAAHLPHDLTAP